MKTDFLKKEFIENLIRPNPLNLRSSVSYFFVCSTET